MWLCFIMRTCVCMIKIKKSLIFNSNFLPISKLGSCLHSKEFKASDKILGVPGPKKFWMPWRMTQKRISRKPFSEKYDFRKSGGARGPGVRGPLAPSSSGGLKFKPICMLILVLLINKSVYLVITFVKLLVLLSNYPNIKYTVSHRIWSEEACSILFLTHKLPFFAYHWILSESS